MASTQDRAPEMIAGYKVVDDLVAKAAAEFAVTN
jgi:hypothetical protein